MIELWHILLIGPTLLYANGLEWALHKYVLHGLGGNKNSIFSYHWHIHHRRVRKSAGYDTDYNKKKWWRIKAITQERLSLFLLLVLHFPLAFWIPTVWLTLVYAMFNYYRVHRKAHLDVNWAKKHLRWHYDHHMGRNQNANWCITRPWFDWIMGTRVHYVEKIRRKNSNFKKR